VALGRFVYLEAAFQSWPEHADHCLPGKALEIAMLAQ
jgi:hypothetical protein